MQLVLQLEGRQAEQVAQLQANLHDGHLVVPVGGPNRWRNRGVALGVAVGVFMSSSGQSSGPANAWGTQGKIPIVGY